MWIEYKRFEKPETDIYCQAYTAYGNTGYDVYLISGNVNYDWPDKNKVRTHLVYDCMTNEMKVSELPECTHYLHEGKLYSTDHEWINSKPYSRFFIDGVLVGKYLVESALDRTLFRDRGQWVIYVRKPIHEPDNLAVMFSKDFINWTPPQDVNLRTDENERVYMFNAFKIGEQWYGIANMLGLSDYSAKPILCEGDDPFNFEQVCELDFSEQFQSFGNIVIKDDTVWLTTIEVDREHTTLANIQQVKEKPYFSRILYCNVEDFKKQYLR